MKTNILFCAMIVTVALFLSTRAEATSVVFKSFDVEISIIAEEGPVFTDPFGHEYDSEVEGALQYGFEMGSNLDEDPENDDDVDFFTQPYNGDRPASDFHLFLSMPFVSQDEDEELAFTHFDTLGQITWISVIPLSKDEISFYAPPGVTLDVGEEFQIEIEGLDFGAPIDVESFGVTAAWTTPAAAESVPEPGTMMLMGIGLAGLAGGAARRKFKKKEVVKH